MDKLDQILEALVGTVEIMGQQMSGPALAIMTDDLDRYPLDDVISALTRVRRECSRFTLAAVLDRMPNSWIGPEEAWATFPKDERESGVVTTPASMAWATALPLWEIGDKIGARMAFKETYEREVSGRSGETPEWHVTLGYDKDQRETAIRRGIEQGKLTAEKVQHLIPDLSLDAGPVVALLTGKVSAMPQNNQTRANIARLRECVEEGIAKAEEAKEAKRLKEEEKERRFKAETKRKIKEYEAKRAAKTDGEAA